MIWHSRAMDDVLNELKTDPRTGLSPEEAEQRLRVFGANQRAGKAYSLFSFIRASVFSGKSVPLLILAVVWLVAAVIWKIPGYLPSAVLAAFLVLRGVVCGCAACFGSRRALALCAGQKPAALVLRGGVYSEVSCDTLVPGDILRLKRGDFIPADCRLLSSDALHCDESVLNGGLPQTEKHADAAGIADIAPIAERRNMLYTGCAVLSGTADAVVTDTGMNTELAKQQEPFGFSELEGLSVYGAGRQAKRIAILAVSVLCGLVFLAGTVRGALAHGGFWLNTLFWVTSAVCALTAFLPERYHIFGYVLCAMKLRRMKKDNITVNRPETLDMLSRVSVICTDKTGSVTQPRRMDVRQVYDGQALEEIQALSETGARVLHLAALCCDGSVVTESGREKRSGDPTQTAILSAALRQLKLTEEDLRVAYPRMSAIPFDRAHKTMCTVNMIDGVNYAIVRGAPDRVLPLCRKADRDAALSVQSAMASMGMRVIAVALKPLAEAPANPTREMLECDLQFAGLLGLSNPLRKNAASAVRTCLENGIATVMLTGDAPENAASYARTLGILGADTGLLTGETLRGMTDEALSANIGQYTVFAGVTARDKTRIVRALQSAGHTVLMTGDELEDIDALRAADVGCTPTGSGTDIAKQASDMVAGGGFAAIVSAILHVRHLYHCIRSMHLLRYGLGISVCLFLLLSVFTGETFSFSQILLAGLLPMLCFPLYYGCTETADVNVKGRYGTYSVYISLAVAFAAAFAAAALPGAGATLCFCALLFAYALLVYRTSLRRSVTRAPLYALCHLVPALAFFAVLVLLTVCAPALGFSALPLSSWLLLAVFCAVPAALYL